MLSKNQVKFIRSLQLKKQREEHQRFVAEGSKLVIDLLESDFEIIAIFGTHEWFDNHPHQTHSLDSFTEVTEEEMKRITGLASPSPVLAIVKIPDHDTSDQIMITDLTLALDEIKDPGNLGTIIRLADWFGITTVICSENTVELYNPKVVQATMGSISRVKVKYLNLRTFFQNLDPVIPVFGTFLEGDNIYNCNLENSAIIIVGSESHGISEELQPLVTKRIHIPSYHTDVNHRKGSPESLNASVATAIACAEFRRRLLH